MTNKQNSILILMLFSIIFLSLEKIKLSFEINRLNNNQENLIKEHESFKDKNIKLITQSYTNNSPAYIERIAKEDLGMVKRKPRAIIKSTANEKN
jgi:cell division protein FtsL